MAIFTQTIIYVFFCHFCQHYHQNYHHNHHCNRHYHNWYFSVICAKHRFGLLKKRYKLPLMGERGISGTVRRKTFFFKRGLPKDCGIKFYIFFVCVFCFRQHPEFFLRMDWRCQCIANVRQHSVPSLTPIDTSCWLFKEFYILLFRIYTPLSFWYVECTIGPKNILLATSSDSKSCSNWQTFKICFVSWS